MERWHVTLILALLAAAGVAIAGVPVIGAVGVAAVTVVRPVQAPAHAPAALVPVIPEIDADPPPHTAPIARPVTGIPEIDEPPVAARPPAVVLPPEPPIEADPCPGCGMG